MIREKKLSLLKKRLGERAKLDEPMGRHTTFKIGGPADLFFEAKTEEELDEVVRLSRELKVPFFILGGGSNLLFSDEGFRGIVVKNRHSPFAIRHSQIIAGSGTPLARLVKAAEENSLTGLEFAVGIPGTIGGAVVGNSGVRDKAIGDIVEEVKILDEKEKIITLNNPECHFGYRSSILQKKPAVILEVILKLKKGNKKETREKMQQSLEKRKNQPQEPSAGSVFKNPPGQSAGELIEEVDLKGKRSGGAQISTKHANWIVNLGSASCRDVLKLISLAKKRVKAKFGIELEEEIKRVGEV